MALQHFKSNEEDFFKTLEYTKEVQNVFETQDVQKHEKVINNVLAIREKSLRSRNELKRMTKSLESQKVKLTNEVCALYGNIVQDVAPGDTPNIQKAEEIIKETKRQVNEERQILNSIREQKRDIACAEKQVKLQQRALPIQFDHGSTKENVQGFIKRENNSIEVFSFNLTLDNPVDIANHLWGHNKH